MDYHHDRIKGATKRVVMHSRVSSNSYNINAQVTSNLKTVVKQKILNGVICTSTCLCLGTMLAFLRFMNVDPKAPTWFFLNDVVANLEWNAMHDIKNER
jgi:hypothetical protein